MTEDWVVDALTGVDANRVAVVGRARRGEIAGRVRLLLPAAEVSEHDVDPQNARAHVDLAALGPFDVVLDSSRGRSSAERIPRLFYHLRVGGWLLMARPQTDDGLLDLLLEAVGLRDDERLAAPVEPRDQRPARERDLHALAASIGRVEIGPRHVAVEQLVDAAPKLFEREGDHYLAARPQEGRVLHHVPSVRWQASNQLDGNDSERVAALPRRYDGRGLSVREWRDAWSLPHGGVLGSHAVAPDTYRRRHDSRLRSEAVVDWAPGFVRRPPRPTEVLDGVYLHLDNEWRGHFGHAMTEQVAKLWAWAWLKERQPDARVLVHARPDAPVRAWERALLEAGGVSAADLVVCERPVRVERLVTASPALSTPTTLHPLLRQTYDDLGAALERSATRSQWPRRVFLGRRDTFERTCHNAADVEALARAHGFVVVHPEEHPLADQATFVRRADVVAGFVGSGMYSIALAGGPRRVICIGSDSYTGWVEPRLAGLLGHSLTFVWCPSDVGPTSSYSRAAFKAGFTFRMQEEGRFLERVLAGLPSDHE